jgi:hypothetical protein
VLSLHFAVAFSGVPAGGVTIAAFPVVFAGAAAAVVAVLALAGAGEAGAGEAAAALPAGGAGAAFSSANQVVTPPWLEHAPFLVLALLYVPSLHCAVASAGFACAASGTLKSGTANARAPAIHDAENSCRIVRIVILLTSFWHIGVSQPGITRFLAEDL